MAFYLTQHLPPLGTPPPGHLHPASPESFKRTVIPPLDSGFPSTTTTRFQHPPASQQQQQQQQPPTHPLADTQTLTHLLHTFHTHQHDNTTGTAASNGGNPHPAFDLAETRSCYTIYGDLPGLRRSDVTVETDDVLCTVTISGTLTRKKPGEVQVREGVQLVQDGEDGVHWHVRERGAGKFRRQFHLPVGTVEMAAARARMEEGVLAVVVPKTVGEMAREGVVRGRKVVWEMEGGGGVGGGGEGK
ncbi:HSP20-like chaperone [Podospora conica]|nr:HSP20-like chaperone [Schizothecium conicum]